MSMRQCALWGLLAAKLAGGWGVGWDIRWHILVGRDSFWIPPHVLTYASVAIAVALSLGVLVEETRAARRGARPADTVKILGLVGTPGFHLAWWGIALTVLAAPLDDLWHRLFGIDVTLWSPPHLLGFAGAQVNTLGCLLIAVEAWRERRGPRALALLAGSALLLGLFHVIVEPAVRTAFLGQGLAFFTYAILASLAFGFTLTLAARLTDWRSAPVLVAAGAVLLHLGTLAVADAGFAWLRPTSTIETVIAADPASPIAVAHEIARRNGTPPGRSMALRLSPLLPAVVMALVDPRRRWPRASLAFGATLLVVSGLMLGRSPALAHALPARVDLGPALALTLAASLVGAWCAVRLGALFLTRRPVIVPAREPRRPSFEPMRRTG